MLGDGRNAEPRKGRHLAETEPDRQGPDCSGVLGDAFQERPAGSPSDTTTMELDKHDFEPIIDGDAHGVSGPGFGLRRGKFLGASEAVLDLPADTPELDAVRAGDVLDLDRKSVV